MKLYLNLRRVAWVCLALASFAWRAAAQTPPTVAQPAAANPNPVTNQSCTVTVLGSDAQDETNLIYTWYAITKPLGAADPAFNPVGGAATGPFNGSHAAQNSTAQFSIAGNYVLQVVIQNPSSLTATSTVAVAVLQTVSQFTLAPVTHAVITNSTLAYAATILDQFANPISPAPALTWSVSGGGTIDNTGLFAAGSTAGGPYAVQAQAVGLSATATVYVAVPNQYPQIALSSPANGQVFAYVASPLGGGANVTLMAVLLDPNGVVTNVQYFADSLLLGSGQFQGANTNTFFWSGAPVGTHSLVAHAQDADGGALDTTPVTIQVASPPTIVQLASANPNPVTNGTTSILSVLADDPTGETNLTYTWSVNLGALAFTPNANNAAKNTTATFAAPGTYYLQVAVQNGFGLAVTNSLVVSVESVMTSARLSSSNLYMVTNTSREFFARIYDQFGTQTGSLTNPVWSATGGGTLVAGPDSGGETFTAGSAPGGPFTLTAQSSDLTASALIVVETPGQYPQVTLTSPTNGQYYAKAHTNVILSATLNDPAGAVIEVKYLRVPTGGNYNDPNQFIISEGYALAPPYTVSYANPPQGDQYTIARAYLNDLTTADSGYVHYYVNTNQPVQLAIASPTNVLVLKAGTNNVYTISGTMVDPDDTVTNISFVDLNTGISVPQTIGSNYSMTRTNSDLGKLLWAPVATLYDGSTVTGPMASVIIEPAQVPAVPPYSSYPAARVKLYLDFTGGYVPNWAHNVQGFNTPQPGGVYIPPYDIDGDSTTFSPAELENIHQAWLLVAEAFSPFNVDVTTINPGEDHFEHASDCAKVVIGGTDLFWAYYVNGDHGREPGIATISGYTEANQPDAATCYVQGDLPVVSNMGWLSAHEAGHLFGLSHEHGWAWDIANIGQWSVIAEYGWGTWQWVSGHRSENAEFLKSPIMGSSGAHRSIWGVAWTAMPPIEPGAVPVPSYPPTQDDVAMIASTNSMNGMPNNGFGYRPPDHGNSIPTADPLTVASNVISGSGVIQTLDDRDFFSFASPGGPISITIAPPYFGNNTAGIGTIFGTNYTYWGMLDVKAELFAADGTRLVLADNEDSFTHLDPSETISTNLAPGTYYLAVESQGNYGDIGQYFITGTLVVPPVPPPVITGMSLSPSGQFTLQVTASTNSASTQAFTVLSTTDLSIPLANWTVLGIATNVTLGVFQFTDPAATNAQRFYTIRSP